MPLLRNPFPYCSGVGLGRPVRFALGRLAVAAASNLTQSTSANAVTSAAINTQACQLLTLVASWTGTAPTLTDSASNTWSSTTVQTQGTISTQLFYVITPLVSAAHTFTLTGTATKPSVAVVGFQAAPLAFNTTGGGTTAGATSLARNHSVTPGPFLILSGLVTADTTLPTVAVTPANTWVSAGSLGAAGTANAMAIGMSWNTFNIGNAAPTMTWSWTNSVAAAMTDVAFA